MLHHVLVSAYYVGNTSAIKQIFHFKTKNSKNNWDPLV